MVRIFITFFVLLSLAIRSDVICFEAENANVIYPNMEIIADKNVSGGYCLGIREYAGTRNKLPSKNVKTSTYSVYGVDISKDGYYMLALNVFWDDGCGNSFLVEVDKNRMYKAADSVIEKWHWTIGGGYYLKKGFHKILIREREDGVYVDKIALVSNEKSIDFNKNPPKSNYMPMPIENLPEICTVLSSDTKLIEPGKPVKLLLWLRNNRKTTFNGTIAINAKFAKMPIPSLKVELKPDDPVKIIPIQLQYSENTPSRQHPVRIDIFSGKKHMSNTEIMLKKPFTWDVIGPFTYQKTQETLNRSEKRFDPLEKYQEKNGMLQWKTYPTDKLFNSAGLADFNKLFGNTVMATVFLRTVIASEKEQKLNMHILCDDICRIRLNNQIVAEKTKCGPAIRKTINKQVQLKKGKNTVLVQVNQLKGYWNFKIFFTELDGALCKTIKGL